MQPADHRAAAPSPSPAPRVRPWVLLILLAVVVALAGGGAYLWQSARLRAERQQGLDLADHGHFLQAEPMLQHALQRNPNDLDVVKALALGCLADNEGHRLLTDAEPYLTRWCQLQPDDAEPFRLRLELWLRLGRFAAALDDGQRLLELEPEDDDLRGQVAKLLASAGRFDEAERECRRCLDRQPGSPVLRYLLADIQHSRGDNAAAEAGLDPLLREQPRFGVALLLRAILHNEAGHYEQAVPLLRQVLTLDPAFRKQALYQLSLALDRTGRRDEAERAMADLRRVQDAERLALDSGQQPDNVQLGLRAAQALLDAGALHKGFPVLEQILKREPDNVAARRLKAAYKARGGQSGP